MFIRWFSLVFFGIINNTALLYQAACEKYLKVGSHATNVDSFIGREGVVIKPVEKYSTGQVKVWGQIWTAVSENGEVIPQDSRIRVKAVEGVKLVVEAIEDTNIGAGE